ncbi:MAG: molybdopterin-guanine dinucleotide biosynthesis protein B [Cycloclasticus sp.]
MNAALSLPVLGFSANSGTGKTTLISLLLPLLKERGLQVGLIKHSHHNFETDQPGKDSYRLRKAGASPVLLVSKYRRAIITELPGDEPRLEDQLACFPADSLDLMIVEGFKHESFPKIELHRAELKAPLLFRQDPSIIAIASDTPLSTSLPCLDLNKPEEVADFIYNEFLSKENG